MEDSLEFEAVNVRRLLPADLESVIQLDAKVVGRRRDEYFKIKLKQALSETGIEVSLAAELEGLFVGFLLARVYYGEFGTMEAVAVLDTLGVNPDFAQRGVGRAILDQLCKNLRGLGIPKLRTEVSWDNQVLLRFFHDRGFAPAPQLCLELNVKDSGL